MSDKSAGKKLQTIDDLRELALEALEKLRDGRIDLAEAVATGKLCDSVINTVKSQMDYNRMVDEKSNKIPFMANARVVVTVDEQPKLEQK
jgi:hypothetical protein